MYHCHRQGARETVDRRRKRQVICLHSMTRFAPYLILRGCGKGMPDKIAFSRAGQHSVEMRKADAIARRAKP